LQDIRKDPSFKTSRRFFLTISFNFTVTGFLEMIPLSRVASPFLTAELLPSSVMLRGKALMRTFITILAWRTLKVIENH
jgi:hypothetical protein